MSKTRAAGMAIAAVAVAVLAAGAAVRLQRDRSAKSPLRRQVPEAAPGVVQAPVEAPPPEPVQAPNDPVQGAGTEFQVWRDAQDIADALIVDEVRRKTFMQAFIEMVRRIREIETARVRYAVEGEKTVIEIPAFREEGQAIRAEWLKKCFELLTPEERTRFTENPEFESGRVSPELDLLRAVNLFNGSRRGKDMKPDFLWDNPHRIEVQRFSEGKVQVRVAAPEHFVASQFDSQQEALNYLTRAYGHLLGPIPQLFK